MLQLPVNWFHARIGFASIEQQLGKFRLFFQFIHFAEIAEALAIFNVYSQISAPIAGMSTLAIVAVAEISHHTHAPVQITFPSFYTCEQQQQTKNEKDHD